MELNPSNFTGIKESYCNYMHRITEMRMSR